MDASYKKLLDGNERFISEKLAKDPDYFTRLSLKQAPEFLWVGCSDSRVPANEITGTDPGEIFVHRNIANMVVHTDVNFLSVLQYAVEVLEVKHIIVCGHYGCGGISTALSDQSKGLVDTWIRNIKEVYLKHQTELDSLENTREKANRLVELNVLAQAANLAKSPIVQRAWKQRSLQIHSWVYGLDSGRIKELGTVIDKVDDVDPIFHYSL